MSFLQQFVEKKYEFFTLIILPQKRYIIFISRHRIYFQNKKNRVFKGSSCVYGDTLTFNFIEKNVNSEKSMLIFISIFIPVICLFSLCIVCFMSINQILLRSVVGVQKSDYIEFKKYTLYFKENISSCTSIYTDKYKSQDLIVFEAHFNTSFKTKLQLK